jgi:hypothetical protein
MFKYYHDILEASVSLETSCWCAQDGFSNPARVLFWCTTAHAVHFAEASFIFRLLTVVSNDFRSWSQQTARHTTSWLWPWHFYSYSCLCQQKCEAYSHVTVNYVWEFFSCWLDSYRGGGGGEKAKTPSITTSDVCLYIYIYMGYFLMVGAYYITVGVLFMSE